MYQTSMCCCRRNCHLWLSLFDAWWLKLSPSTQDFKCQLHFLIFFKCQHVVVFFLLFFFWGLIIILKSVLIFSSSHSGPTKRKQPVRHSSNVGFMPFWGGKRGFFWSIKKKGSYAIFCPRKKRKKGLYAHSSLVKTLRWDMTPCGAVLNAPGKLWCLMHHVHQMAKSWLCIDTLITYDAL